MPSDFHAKILSRLVDVGVPKFNLAHERLCNIIIDADVILGSALETQPLTLAQWDTLSGLFDDLIAYAKIHFTEEEEFLHVKNYPDLAQHRTKHNKLIDDLNAYQKIVQQNDEANIAEIRRWLLEWLLNHVNQEDRAYAQYLF
ncbi:MAG: hemerythrin family protein [Magnetococcus sp. YQC-5]